MTHALIVTLWLCSFDHCNSCLAHISCNAGMADVLVVMVMTHTGTGFMPGPAAPIQGTRASARLAAAGPNPFSAAGIHPHMLARMKQHRLKPSIESGCTCMPLPAGTSISINTCFCSRPCCLTPPQCRLSLLMFLYH